MALELAPPFAPGGSLPGPPLGLLAVWLAGWSDDLAAPLLFVARGERRARLLADAVVSLEPASDVVAFPPWDCLPYDRAQPSRAAMGRRVAALQRLAHCTPRPRLVVTTATALAQRVPPPTALQGVEFALKVGQEIDRAELEGFLRRTGYVVDERVDEPGEAALRGGVVDLFPADAGEPVRLEVADGRIAAIRRYEAASQRSLAEVQAATLRPATEAYLPGTDEPAADAHALPLHHPEGLTTLLHLLPRGARLALDRGVEDRLEAWAEQVADAHAARQALRRSEAVADTAAATARALVEPARLYLEPEEWRAALAERSVVRLGAAEADSGQPPDLEPSAPGAAFRWVRRRQAAGDRVALALPAGHPLRTTLARRLGGEPEALASWRDLARLAPGAVGLLDAALPGGFVAGELAVVGGPAGGAEARPADARPADELLGLGGLRPGDRVVHAEHGIAELVGLEALDEAGGRGEHLVLRFAGDRRLLVPVAELDRVWRYGTEEADVPLDRLDGGAWAARRDEVAAEVARAADALARLAAERARAEAPPLPAPEGFPRFVRRFPFEPSEDQAAAIDAVLGDLARGSPPMDRLVCGDVGFGKTEVALRAAAVAALSGWQVAVLAPTTLLVGQHLLTFRRRFAGLGVRVEQLSRLGGAAEQRAVKQGLADGSVQVVVGTHGLASPGLRFARLGLVVVDEEQRFGTRQKAALARLRRGVHTLTMTATPIPRTLQAALAGLQELSVIATPPQRRLPVRTFVLPFDGAVVREALWRERRRGGRSFVVVPRIADLEPMRERLAGIAGDLDLAVAHGRMKAAELDGVMLAFAAGEHDVLLTTSIVETGLDVPGADTMLVWRPDRFGVAQLHQLRGRVGRGRERAACYLLHEPSEALAEAARRRLETLTTFESLGAGFAVAARDLDLRGAGSLVGEEQAGHLKRIGTGLYQHLLERALRRARGERVAADWSPQLALDVDARLPEGYVPEPELRLDLYARLARPAGAPQLEELAQEIADRFGEPPPEAIRLLDLAGLRRRCRGLGVAKLEAGPKAVAASFRDEASAEQRWAGWAQAAPDGPRWSGGRLLLAWPSASADERLAAATALLELIEAGPAAKRQQPVDRAGSTGRSSAA